MYCLREIKRKQKGGFVKGLLWRMYPRSEVWRPGVSKIIAFFCQGSTVGKHFLKHVSVQDKTKN